MITNIRFIVATSKAKVTQHSLFINLFSMDQPAIIESEAVNIHCYTVKKPKLIEKTLQGIRSNPPQNTDKPVKVVLFVIELSPYKYEETVAQTKSHFSEEFQRFFINIVMVGRQEEIPQLIGHIERVNSPQFEISLVHMHEESVRKAEKQLIEDILAKKFKWTKPRSDYFLQHNRIFTLRDLLGQESILPVWQSAALREMRSFLEFCQYEQGGKQEQDEG